MFYEEQLIRAIRTFIAPDVMTALRSATSLEMISPTNSVRVPLQAGVDVAYEKGFAAFCVTATIRDADKDRWLGGKSFFSTIDISRARDKAAIIEHMFDEAKKQMLAALAAGELDRILENPGRKESEK